MRRFRVLDDLTQEGEQSSRFAEWVQLGNRVTQDVRARALAGASELRAREAASAATVRPWEMVSIAVRSAEA